MGVILVNPPLAFCTVFVRQYSFEFPLGARGETPRSTESGEARA